MSIDVVEHSVKVAVVSPKQSVDAFTSENLKGQLLQLLESGTSRLVIDLSAVPFLDSAGLAVLVTALKRCRQIGAEMRLVWPQAEAARRIIHLTKFHKIFAMADSAADAMGSF